MPEDYGTERIPSSEVGPFLVITVGPNQVDIPTRLASDPETQAYMERRVKEGRTKREVIRMLKRYVAREVYRQLPRG